MTFFEFVKKTGLDKSTIHRPLSSGIKDRLICSGADRKVFRLGSRAFDLGRNAYSGYLIQTVALDEIVRLYIFIDANVTIDVPSSLEALYLRVLETRQSLGDIQRPGVREPVHCLKSGKALVAYLPTQTLQGTPNRLEPRIEGFGAKGERGDWRRCLFTCTFA